MGQISFSDAEYAGKRKKTRREVFLEEMELVVPWKALLGLIEPHYPVAGRGRRPYPLEAMLRVHLMQNWFALRTRRWKKRCTRSPRCALSRS
jgi:transposase, IS5 family